MKCLAFVISFYIIVLSAVPMAKFIWPEVNGADCGKKCCKYISQKNANGCSETCSSFSCCLKAQAVYQQEEKQDSFFVPENFIKNNFSNTQVFISHRDFDIWHPPRAV